CGFGVWRNKNAKTLLTESEAGHRSHSTDAVLLTGTLRRSPKTRRTGRPEKKGLDGASVFVAI
ncbi:hypothetical protein K9B35_20075, partial [Sphingomonas sp. R647]|uniref:hypothetical protein n=1 Tax=Sphingomonas sp. R647 TaxID=2875233 RepID=UPI001CD805FB